MVGVGRIGGVAVVVEYGGCFAANTYIPLIASVECRSLLRALASAESFHGFRHISERLEAYSKAQEATFARLTLWLLFVPSMLTLTKQHLAYVGILLCITVNADCSFSTFAPPHETSTTIGLK